MSPSKLQPNAAMMLARSSVMPFSLYSVMGSCACGRCPPSSAAGCVARKVGDAVSENEPSMSSRRSGRQRALQPFHVEPERGVVDARLALVALHHLVGIGHARHALRIDERNDLDVVQAGLRQRVDQLDLALGRDRAFLELEALARAFLVDLHEFREVGHAGAPGTLRRLNTAPPPMPRARDFHPGRDAVACAASGRGECDEQYG